jgi:hypothetical protein
MDWSLLVAGFGGGAVRGIVGFIKHQYSYKSVKFDIYYFLFMTFISGVVGLIAASLLDGIIKDPDFATPAFALIAGYAGGDFIENMYKILAKKPSLYTLADK